MHVYDLQSYKAQSLPQKDLFYIKEKADPDRVKTAHSNMSTSRCGNIWKFVQNLKCHPNVHIKKEGVVSVTAVVLMQPCQGDAVCFCANAKALFFVKQKDSSDVKGSLYNHLGKKGSSMSSWSTFIFKSVFKKIGSVPTLLWQSGPSESATVCFVINFSICYWLFKCGVMHVVCACVCVCTHVCVRERNRVT